MDFEDFSKYLSYKVPEVNKSNNDFILINSMRFCTTLVSFWLGLVLIGLQFSRELQIPIK